MLVHIKELISAANKGKYAVGAFNIHNLESVLGVARAAVESKSPAIIQVSESAITYMGLKPITHIVSTVAKNVAAKVPIALHLDHGRSFDSVFECINAGFTSVHIDASHMPLDENINLTKYVVEMAHSKGVWVQGEVGGMVGSYLVNKNKKIDIPLADVKDVARFVKETGIDSIAAAVGTAHGVYQNEDINLPLLKEIVAKTKISFVLHGGSGIEDAKIKQAIKSGVDVINIGTDIKVAFCSSLIKNCLANRHETDPRNLLRPTIDEVAKAVKAKMKLFGSVNRIDVGKIVT